MVEQASSTTMFLEIKSQHIALNIGNLYLLGKNINGIENKHTNFIKLDEGEEVEEKHCIIEVAHSEDVFVFDLFSSKGTLVNNKALKALEKLRLKNGDTLQVGNQEVKYFQEQQEVSHDSSGFLDVNKNTSDIIVSSPDSSSQQESRIKRVNNNNFLVPQVPPKRLDISNKSLLIPESEAINFSRNSLNGSSASLNSTTNRRSDSFTIPETQYCKARNSLNASDLSIAESIPEVNSSKKLNFGNLDDFEDDEFCIPETQEVLPKAGSATSTERPRVLSGMQGKQQRVLTEEPTNMENTNNELEGSQFRICTQDYNEGFGEEENECLVSQIIPLIKHNTVVLNNTTTNSSNENSKDQSKVQEEDKELSALKWNNSEINNENTELRADCSTPDIFDFGDLDQESGKSKDNVADKPNNIEPEANLDMEDEEDLMPTQVFPSANAKPTEKKAANEQEICVEKENEDILTLSDKENRCPVILEPVADLPPTQLFATNEVQAAKSSGLLKSGVTIIGDSKNSSKPLLNLDADEEDDLLTQAFLQPSNQTSSSSCHKNIPNKVFNSTVLEDKFLAKNPATFFAEIEKNPLKETSSPDTAFKMPDKDFGIVRKATSTASTASENDLDMLMCTPQLIKEHILLGKTEDLKKSILAVKNKHLFGDETDEEPDDDEGDLVKLINVPKDSQDFDKLLPHLNKKAELNKSSQEDLASKEAQKVYKFNISFGKDQDENHSNSSLTKSSSLSRDERHVARDKERELAERKERSRTRNTTKEKVLEKKTKLNESATDKKKETSVVKEKEEKTLKDHKSKESLINKTDLKSSSPQEKEKVTKKDTEEKSSKKTKEEKKDKEDKKTRKKKEDKPLSKEEEENSATKTGRTTRTRKQQASTEKTDKAKDVKTEDPVKAIPARRMTRAKSRLEEGPATSKENVSQNSKPNQNEDDLDSIATQPFIRLRRCRSRSKNSESHDSITSNSTQRKTGQHNKSKNDSISSNNSSVIEITTKKTSGDRKRKAEPTLPAEPVKTERKRLRSTDSSSTHSSTLNTVCISMTMVDKEEFNDLLKRNKGFWNVAANPADSEVLVMDKAFRTFKFLLAMARGIPIVTSNYLKKLNETQRPKTVRINDYLFVDEKFESKHKFSFAKSLQMAMKHKLFKGYEFVMTGKILPNPQEIKAIIEASGGLVHPKNPPQPKENQKLYLVTAKEDKKDWHRYRRINQNIIIVSTEAIMSAVMRQSCERMSSYTLA